MKNTTAEKKNREAAAIQYSPDKDNAPIIVALGTGDVADKIIEKAKDSNVPVYQDTNLAGILNAMNVGDEIPRELYGIVAEILVFISGMDKDYGEKYGIK